ncbi:MAG: LptA/OstA family protein [Terriglobales bacterium]
MPVNISRLRVWFATSAIALVVLVAGVYFYGRMRVHRALREVPKNLGVNIQQSTQGFTLSKSEGGRTIFTVHASRAVQYKEGGRAELRDVSIIVYGRQANRYDQIYGSQFAYDPATSNITAQGEVHIDIEGNAAGPISPDQAQPTELKNPIHLKTSGLVFNQKTGMASTKERIEFRVPQANGSALGATYDSKAAMLTLERNIVVQSTGADAATITADHGVITKGPDRAVLNKARVERSAGDFSANTLTIYLRDDQTVEHLVADGNVRLDARGTSVVHAAAPRGDAWIDQQNRLRTAVLTGGVQLESTGEQTMHGSAGKMTMEFDAANRLQKALAGDGVKLLQQPGRGAGHPVELAAGSVDFLMANGRSLQRAVTNGAAQLKVLPQAGASGRDAVQTVVTAARFEATFNRRGRMERVTGVPDARVVSSSPGQPDKTSTSDHMEMTFNASGGVATLLQDGHFHYAEPASGPSGERAAWADHARYTPSDQLLVLTGAPRIVDGGMTTTAASIRLDRRSGDATATGDVKTTYSELKSQSGGALLASSEPIHVTAHDLKATRQGGLAVFSDGARLWQGPNIIEAPRITFDRQNRLVEASDPQAGARGRVSTVFVQRDKDGKLTPVNVLAARLTYQDEKRLARFEGGVVVRSSDTTITAKSVDVLLQPRGQTPTTASQAGPSQVDRVIALGEVNIQQPNRRATGEKLVYTAFNGTFALSGGPPSIFDAERGKITGDSLTFNNRDDRVLVESKNSSPTVTQTRVAK